MPEICTERPRLITRFHLKNNLLGKQRISILDKARAYRYALERRAPIVRHKRAYKKGMRAFEFEDNNLFAGSTTGKFKGVPLYPEFLALALWPELWTISERENNPYHITKAEVKELNYKIFPHWIENTILELARKRSFVENLKEVGRKNFAPEIKLLEGLVFFMASKPNCIARKPDDSYKIHEPATLNKRANNNAPLADILPDGIGRFWVRFINASLSFSWK